jgi:GTPase SAR1 family protein
MHKPNASYNFTDFKSKIFATTNQLIITLLFTVIMVGDSGVGKTSFHNIINTGCVSINTPATTMPAIAVRTFVNENSDVIKINFWDTGN